MTREEHTISRVIYRLGKDEVRQAILGYAAWQGISALPMATEIEIREDGTAIITSEYAAIKEPKHD